MVVLYTDYCKRYYHGSVLSKAGLFQWSTYAFIVVVPFVVAYASHGFWLKQSTYLEQPSIKFKHEMMIVVRGAGGLRSPPTELLWSTIPAYNSLVQEHIRVPIIKSYEVDDNNDGVNDAFHMTVQMPLQDNEHANSLQMLLMFDVQLTTQVRMRMEGLAYVVYDSPLSGSSFHLDATMELHQDWPLPHQGERTLYDKPVVDPAGKSLADFALPKIFSDYQKRNETTHLVQQYPVWSSGRGRGQPFTVNVVVRYPVMEIMYRPGVYEVLKMAWIQYFSVLVLFFICVRFLRRFVYLNQIVQTHIEYPSPESLGIYASAGYVKSKNM